MKQKMLLIGMCFLAGYLNAWSHPSHPEGKENFHGLLQKLYESINVYQTGHTNPYYNRTGGERPVLVLYNETTGQRTTLTRSDTLKYLPKAEIVDFMLSTDPQKTGKDVGVFLQVTIRNKGNEMKTGVPFSGQDFLALPDTVKDNRKGDLDYLGDQAQKAFYDYAEQTILDFKYMFMKGVFNEQEQYSMDSRHWLKNLPRPEEVRYLEITLRSNTSDRPLVGAVAVYLKDEEKTRPEGEKGNLYGLFRKIYENTRIYTTGYSSFNGAHQLNAFPTFQYPDVSGKYSEMPPYYLKNVHGRELKQFEMYIDPEFESYLSSKGTAFVRIEFNKTTSKTDTLVSRKDKLPLILPNTHHPEEKGKFVLFVQRMNEALNSYNGEKDAEAIRGVYWNDAKEKIDDADLAQIQPDSVKTIVLEYDWQGNRLVGNIRIYSDTHLFRSKLTELTDKM